MTSSGEAVTGSGNRLDITTREDVNAQNTISCCMSDDDAVATLSDI